MEHYILQSVLLFEEVLPPPPLPPLEAPPPAVFSVAQLQRLWGQLSLIAPEGYMLTHTFVDTLYGFTDNAVSGHCGSRQYSVATEILTLNSQCGEFLLPDSWYGVKKEQVSFSNEHYCMGYPPHVGITVGAACV